MKSFLLKEKSKKTFDEKLQTLGDRTQRQYKKTVVRFEKFCNDFYNGRDSAEIFAELNFLKGQEKFEAIYDVLQNWTNWNYVNKVKTSSVKGYNSHLRKVFYHYGIKLDLQDMKENLDYKKDAKEEPYALQLKDIQHIFRYANPKKLAYYLALISTGARPVELIQVRKKDIDISGKRVKITLRASSTKTLHGRSVWLTKEASSYLMPRLKNLSDDDLVFRTSFHLDASGTEERIFCRYCDKAGYSERYESNNYRKITLYSFRSFFFGVASDVHREGYAHRMTGHGGYLPQYDRMNDDKKLDWFLKIEPYLTISDDLRNKLEIEAQRKKLDEFEKLTEENSVIKQRLTEVEKILSSEFKKKH